MRNSFVALGTVMAVFEVDLDFSKFEFLFSAQFPALLSISAVNVIGAGDLGRSLARSAPIAFCELVQFLAFCLCE